MVASAFVTFMIGTSGILSVISGISGPGDPLAFFRLIHSLPDYFNWIAIILVACLAASSIDTLQNSILITVITDFQVSSLPFARFLTALLNIPIVLFVHFKLDVYSVFYLICSMVFLPLLMGLVTHFNLQRRLDGIDFFVGVVLSCVSVITLGVVLNDGSIFKGFELLRLPLGISQSTPTFYAYVVGPIMSVFAMMVSSVLRLNWFIKIEGTKNDNDRGIQDAVIENTYLEDRGKGIV